VARELKSPPEGELPEEEFSGSAKRSALDFLKELPILIALALGIALLIKAFLVQAFYIPSASMEPTLQERDRVLVNKLTYRFGDPKRGDVVVFKDPFGDPCEERGGAPVPESCDRNVFARAFNWFGEIFGLPTGETRDFIKRIVGLPGETLEIKDGEVFINGERVEFPSTADEGPHEDNSNMAPIEIPQDQYFVMGDNRANSSDSRTFKAISRELVVGKAFVLVWPPTRFSGL
jgi:signal peptidase I